ARERTVAQGLIHALPRGQAPLVAEGVGALDEGLPFMESIAADPQSNERIHAEEVALLLILQPYGEGPEPHAGGALVPSEVAVAVAVGQEPAAHAVQIESADAQVALHLGPPAGVAVAHV